MSNPGRPKLPERGQVILRVDKSILAETYTLRPELRDASGGTRYGALNTLFTSLLVQDNERIKARIRQQAEAKANAK